MPSVGYYREYEYKRRAADPDYDAKKRRVAMEHHEAKMILMYSCLDECVDCGNEHPDVLEFDHVHEEPARTASGRRIGIASMSRLKMLCEVAKCEVRCANCHKIWHAAEARGGDAL